MSAILKRDRALFEHEDEDSDDQMDERNKCRRCGKFFVRLTNHMRKCQQHHYSDTLNDARRALRAKKHRKLARSSNPQETAAQNGVIDGPQPCSPMKSANDIKVRRNHAKIFQNGALTDVM
jgi:hypothetical protein